MNLNEYLNKIQRSKGFLIIISGPSGVGKGTVIKRLMEACPNLSRCVTCTTRAPRPGEVEGVDYCFLTAEQFRQMVEAGRFLEYAHVHLNYYGTPLASVEKIVNRGEGCILEIDVQGGIEAKKRAPDAVMIFLAPPSMEELERRLRGRGTESASAVAKRLANAQKELDCIPGYDYLVVNDNIDEAAHKIECIILAERARIKRYE